MSRRCSRAVISPDQWQLPWNPHFPLVDIEEWYGEWKMFKACVGGEGQGSIFGTLGWWAHGNGHKGGRWRPDGCSRACLNGPRWKTQGLSLAHSSLCCQGESPC
jgi:hypothetical protein